MLPTSQKASADDDVVSPIKPKTPEEKSSLSRKISFKTLHPYLSLHHPRIWLLIVIFLLQILLLLSARSSPFSATPTTIAATTPSPKPSAATNPSPKPSAATNPSPKPSAATTPSPKPSAATISPAISVTNNSNGDDDKSTQCPYGKVYVYSLPSKFNTEIVQNCHQLNPWKSGCGALSNGGFGPEAAREVSNVVPRNLTHAWFWTDQFPLEVIYHNRMMNHKCRTLEPESAAAFYIPFYAGLAVGRYLWYGYSTENRDRDCKMMLSWVRDQPYWNRSDGWDHFMSIGRITWDFRREEGKDWGSSCIYLPGMRNITRLLIERNPWDYFDIGVPYPTGFHPTSAADVAQWQHFVRTRHRRTLYCFAGATRRLFKNDFRGLLLRQCNSEPGLCGVVDCTGSKESKCANGTSEILQTFLDSDFCLQPRGDSFTRRSIFDCMVAGSIPVFFWRRTAYLQYEWFLPNERESYSVFVDRNGVKNGTISIKSVLQSFSQEKIKLMREKVIETIPRIVYAKPNQGLEGVSDAFDIAIEGALKRIKEQEGGDKG